SCRDTAAGASSASASMREFKQGSFNIYVSQLQIAVEHDDVAPSPERQAPAVGGAKVVGRIGGDAARGVLKVQTQFIDQVAQGLIHRQGGPGQRAVGKANASEAFGDLVAAQFVLAVWHVGCGSGVRHAVEAGNRPQRDADGAGVDVQQVGDDFRVLRVGQG